MNAEFPQERRFALSDLKRAARATGRALTDLVLPPQCLACDRPVTGEGALCASCWSRLRMIERPYCERLGTPFAYDLGEGALSAEAIADPPPFGRCRAVAAFDDIARQLVHGLKYRDRLELALWMAGWMARAGGELVAETDIVVPVPMHRFRLWWRRFNQSALLADRIARQAGIEYYATPNERAEPTCAAAAPTGLILDVKLIGTMIQSDRQFHAYAVEVQFGSIAAFVLYLEPTASVRA